jgi:hypothetical protein
LSEKRNTKWIIDQSKLLFGDSFDYSATDYRDAKTKIKFHCKKHDYSFEQTSNNHLKSKHPCKFCLQEARRAEFSDSIHTFKNKIRAIYGNQFDFKNANYVNQRTPISLKCVKHSKVITKEPQVFLRGHGCDLCAKEESSVNLSRQTLNEINRFVDRLNGKCLSKSYLNNEAKLDFECNAGHKFQKSWSTVKNSLRWCPKCSPNKLIGETLARLILEHLLQLKLPSVYIKEMEGLQLDGYDAKNRIAFEYQGYQHYTENSHFHSDERRYNSQVERDRYKKQLCKKNKITLIEIFEFKTIRAGRIQHFVNQVKKTLNNLKLSFSRDPFQLDLVELYLGKKSDLYEQAKKIVEKNNGTIQEFIGAESKHTYTCSKGHKTTNRVLSVIIKSNASCAFCEAQSKYEVLKEIIESKGGKLIDRKLKPKGYSELYKWVCNNGHQRESKGQYLFNGSYCVECQKEAQKKQLSTKQLAELKKDVISEKFYQKDIPIKYGIGDGVYRRIIAELGLKPKYIPQNRKVQKKRTKGKLFQIDPLNFEVIKEFESLEAVKYDESGFYKPEGIRQQMKKNKKAYGYYWSRVEDLEETLKLIKTNTTNSK